MAVSVSGYTNVDLISEKKELETSETEKEYMALLLSDNFSDTVVDEAEEQVEEQTEFEEGPSKEEKISKGVKTIVEKATREISPGKGKAKSKSEPVFNEMGEEIGIEEKEGLQTAS